MADDPTANRRPLASRRLGVVHRLAEALARAGVSPNAISLAGIGFALLAALALLQAGVPGPLRLTVAPSPLGWLVGLVFVQLRLLANLLDGLVAVEGGRGSATGPLYNEVPDRIEDTAILWAFGVAAGSPALGLWAALAAMACAYVRQVGGGLGQPQSFLGPMAKQHRMAAVSLGCLLGFRRGAGRCRRGPAPDRPLGHPARQPGHGRAAAQAYRKWAARVILAAVLIGAMRFLVGGRARWVGTQPTLSQRIYFANHSSHLDTLVLWAALPPGLRARTRPVAAEDYWGGGPLRRHLARSTLDAVLIRRGAGVEAMAPLRAALRDGGSLIVFPEGTRSPALMPSAFRSGLFHLAREFPGVELVPVYLDNLHRAWPKGTLLPVPVSTAVLFGAPIELAPGEPKGTFLERAREAVCALGRQAHPEAADA